MNLQNPAPAAARAQAPPLDDPNEALDVPVNAMTIDVEDYFHVSAFDRAVSRSEWHGFESRVCRNTERLLEIFSDARTRATFFVLGWVAERFPALVREIQHQGHEIASHGYAHHLVYASTMTDFRNDLRRAREVLESATGIPILGYRAPSFSITRDSLWALDVLIDEGYAYDASIYPVRHDRYGIPEWPRHPHRITRSGGHIWECPGSTVRWAGQNLAIGGGGYFRILPYRWTSMGIGRLNRVEGQPAMFYLHPWEIDPQQPRISVGPLTRIRHYHNLERAEHRLRRLLSDFRFGTVTDMLASVSRPEDRA